MSPKKKAAKKKPATSKPSLFAALKGKKKKYWKVPLKTAQLFLSSSPAALQSIIAITFDDGGGVSQPTVSRARNDCIWFVNLSKTKRTLTLSHWPFLPPQGPIVIPGQSAVGPFLLDQTDTFNGTITCHGSPPFDDDGGPGDPQFDTGG